MQTSASAATNPFRWDRVIPLQFDAQSVNFFCKIVRYRLYATGHGIVNLYRNSAEWASPFRIFLMQCSIVATRETILKKAN
jgi:uncharacterized protein YcsI (UPF0317 family)